MSDPEGDASQDPHSQLLALSADLRALLQEQAWTRGGVAEGEPPLLPAPPRLASPPGALPPRLSDTPPPRRRPAFAGATPPEVLPDLPLRPLPPRPARVSQGGAPVPLSPRSARTAEERRQALRWIEEELVGCQRCRLCEERRHIVFQDGAPDARIAFVGEGPGADEDQQGIPFVGAAGRMLTDIIENVLGLNRSQVYIANVVKCRPPKNRTPEPDEMATCGPFLDRQLEAVEPLIIVTLGATAVKRLLGTDAPVGQLRGRFRTYRGNISVMPTYHPAYLLRSPTEKVKVFEDMKKVREEYARLTGQELPPIRTRRAAPGAE